MRKSQARSWWKPVEGYQQVDLALKHIKIYGVPKSWGYLPPVLIQSFDHFSIETYGNLGIPHFKKPPRENGKASIGTYLVDLTVDIGMLPKGTMNVPPRNIFRYFVVWPGPNAHMIYQIQNSYHLSTNHFNFAWFEPRKSLQLQIVFTSTNYKL